MSDRPPHTDHSFGGSGDPGDSFSMSLPFVCRDYKLPSLVDLEKTEVCANPDAYQYILRYHCANDMEPSSSRDHDHRSSRYDDMSSHYTRDSMHPRPSSFFDDRSSYTKDSMRSRPSSSFDDMTSNTRDSIRPRPSSVAGDHGYSSNSGDSSLPRPSPTRHVSSQSRSGSGDISGGSWSPSHTRPAYEDSSSGYYTPPVYPTMTPPKDDDLACMRLKRQEQCIQRHLGDLGQKCPLSTIHQTVKKFGLTLTPGQPLECSDDSSSPPRPLKDCPDWRFMWNTVSEPCMGSLTRARHPHPQQCSHYAEFVKCASFVMKVNHYHCSDDMVRRMALSNYLYLGQARSPSDRSSYPPTPSTPHTRHPATSGSDSSHQNRPSSHPSGRSSAIDSFPMDDYGSSLYSSSTGGDRPSGHFSTHSGSFSDRYSMSDHPPHTDHSSGGSGDPGDSFSTSLPFVCRDYKVPSHVDLEKTEACKNPDTYQYILRYHCADDMEPSLYRDHNHRSSRYDDRSSHYTRDFMHPRPSSSFDDMTSNTKDSIRPRPSSVAGDHGSSSNSGDSSLPRPSPTRPVSSQSRSGSGDISEGSWSPSHTRPAHEDSSSGYYTPPLHTTMTPPKDDDLTCIHYAEFVKCASFVIKVKLYRCSEEVIRPMALRNYWYLGQGRSPSDRSSYPPTPSTPHTRYPATSGSDSSHQNRPSSHPSGRSPAIDSSPMDDYSTTLYPSSSGGDRPSGLSSTPSDYKSSDDLRSSDSYSQSVRSSEDYSRSSDLYSSSDHYDKESDRYSGSSMYRSTPGLYGSSSDHYSMSDRPTHTDHSSGGSGDPGDSFTTSLTFVCQDYKVLSLVDLEKTEVCANPDAYQYILRYHCADDMEPSSSRDHDHRSSRYDGMSSHYTSDSMHPRPSSVVCDHGSSSNSGDSSLPRPPTRPVSSQSSSGSGDISGGSWSPSYTRPAYEDSSSGYYTPPVYPKMIPPSDTGHVCRRLRHQQNCIQRNLAEMDLKCPLSVIRETAEKFRLSLTADKTLECKEKPGQCPPSGEFGITIYECDDDYDCED